MERTPLAMETWIMSAEHCLETVTIGRGYRPLPDRRPSRYFEEVDGVAAPRIPLARGASSNGHTAWSVVAGATQRPSRRYLGMMDLSISGQTLLYLLGALTFIAALAVVAFRHWRKRDRRGV